MAPLENPMKELDEKSFESVVKFVSDIRNGKINGSLNIALATVNLIEQIVTDSESTTALSLCSRLRAMGRHVTRALPAELTAANMVRRVLRAVRDEQRAAADQGAEGTGESLQRLVLGAPCRRGTLGPAARDLREPVRDHIAELRAELESSRESISSQAGEHIHSEEVVMTVGASALVERFLRAAAHRRFRLLLAEGTDVSETAGMATRLANAGVAVVLAGPEAVAALMARVTKVVVSAEAALAGGAMLARPGVRLATTAAAQRAVPVLVLAPLYALCPLQVAEQWRVLEPTAPAAALPYQRVECVRADTFAPKFDFVTPDHVSLFITNLGGSSPSYIYRLISELYDSNDYSF